MRSLASTVPPAPTSLNASALSAPGLSAEKISAEIFSTLSPGALDADAFKDVGTGATVDANDRIVYDSRTGALSYDADGSGAGAAVQFATLDNRAALNAGDFVVV